MKRRASPEQLSMAGLFEEAAEEKRCAHLPADMAAAIEYSHGLFRRFHDAILTLNFDAALAVEKEADDLANKLNGGTNFGVRADDDSPGNVLERETAAPDGEIPLWGQCGKFQIDLDGCPTRIEIDGLYSLFGGAPPGFAIHSLDRTKPFPSETGYRSFLASYPDLLQPGMLPDQYARVVIARECPPVQPRRRKGKRT